MRGRTLFLLAVLLALVLAQATFASTGWKAGPTSTAATRLTLTNEATGVAFFHVDSTSTLGAFSNVLATSLANELTLVLIPDANQTTATPGCELRVYASPAVGGTAVTTASGLPQLSADTDGDGIQNDETLDGLTENRRSLTFLGVPGITVEIVTLPGAGEQCLLFVRGSF